MVMDIYYGDGYFFNEYINKDNFFAVLKNIFGENTDTLLSLLLYKLTGGQALYNAEIWHDGNAANIQFPKAKMTSQQLSEFLNVIGKERYSTFRNATHF